MADAATPANNHTLAYLRRMEQRFGQLLDLVVRQQELLVRIDTQVENGFAELTREMRNGFGRNDAALREARNDILLAENRNLNRLSEHYETSIRLNDHDDRLVILETGSSPRPLEG